MNNEAVTDRVYSRRSLLLRNPLVPEEHEPTERAG